MRGERRVTSAQVLAALREAGSVRGAAKAAGCSPALVYQRAEESEELAAELDRLRQRRAQGSAEELTPGLLEDPDVKLALETLRNVARAGGKEDSPRVSAAKALLQHARAVYAARQAALSKAEADLAPGAGPPEGGDEGSGELTPDEAAARFRVVD